MSDTQHSSESTSSAFEATFRLPIHFRYHAPSSTGEAHATVLVHPPFSIHAAMGDRAPLAVLNAAVAGRDAIAVLVPVGDLLALESVTQVTLWTTAVGSLLVLVAALRH